MNEVQKEPVRRTKLRLFLGKQYYTLRRHGKWLFGGICFAKETQENALPFLYSVHQTPLLRKLKGVDMQLQYNKVENLRLATGKLNSLLLRPGETLSYWKAIGKPTSRKGYREGMVLFCGTFSPGVGGGLCQLSNLIYWITLHTPLTVTERYRHSFDVFPDANRTQPFGSGATCVYNYRDLMIRNDTNQTFQLLLRLSDTHLIGEWRCSSTPAYAYEFYEKEHFINLEYWGGYSRNNMLYRKTFSMGGALLQDEYLTENHALMMYAPFLAEQSKEKPH